MLGRSWRLLACDIMSLLFINTMTDRVIFIFEPKEGNKLTLTPMGPPVLSWKEVTLDLCPGSRP